MSDILNISSEDKSSTQPEDRLRTLAEQIKERDRQLHLYAVSNWFRNGLDLLDAKKLLPHGSFERWCKRELCYSKSKAENLMRAAEHCRPHFESVSLTDLPPPTLMYRLTARSVPQEIRDEFIPRLAAGDDVSCEIRTALKRHRDFVRQKARHTLQDHAAEFEDNANSTDEETTEAIESDRNAIRLSALALILEGVGDDLPKLLALVNQAGPGQIFAPIVERELLELDRGSEGLRNYHEHDLREVIGIAEPIRELTSRSVQPDKAGQPPRDRDEGSQPFATDVTENNSAEVGASERRAGGKFGNLSQITKGIPQKNNVSRNVKIRS